MKLRLIYLILLLNDLAYFDAIMSDAGKMRVGFGFRVSGSGFEVLNSRFLEKSNIVQCLRLDSSHNSNFKG